MTFSLLFTYDWEALAMVAKHLMWVFPNAACADEALTKTSAIPAMRIDARVRPLVIGGLLSRLRGISLDKSSAAVTAPPWALQVASRRGTEMVGIGTAHRRDGPPVI
jgi:hypothetical protein